LVLLGLAAITTRTQATGAGPAKQRPAHTARHKAAAATAVKPYGITPDIERFATEVAERHQLPREWLLLQLSQARRLPAVQQLVMPPPAGTAKNWAAYRARFVEPQRIAAGLAFWQTNQAWLAEAERRYGVPPEIVVAVIGVETYYGRITGGFRTLDALATLSFDFPGGRSDRSAYFRSELEALFVLCAREGVDPQALKGSFAGAIGLPQFMPSSLNRWAVDLDGDGRIDLLKSPADAVGSVAHYLAEFGWQRGLPTHLAVVVPAVEADRAALLAPDIKPSFTAAQMTEHGALLSAAGPSGPGLLALIELQNGQQPASYVAGTANFYAITRYNWSSYYAMAVIDLAQALALRRPEAAR
jgi:membrane-bound lytic murein transglycosylase B